MNFPHTASVTQLTKVGGKYTYGDAFTVKCFLQPLDIEEARATGFDFVKASKCFFPIDSGITDGMRVVINGTTLNVKGAVPNQYGNLAHIKAILERD